MMQFEYGTLIFQLVMLIMPVFFLMLIIAFGYLYYLATKKLKK
jgi:hypothetical protein